MALPPFDAGGVKLTVARAFPPVAVTFVGASGTVAGITVLEKLDGGPVPIPLVAFTVNEYAVPLVRPVTVIGPAVPGVVFPPGNVVTV
jgi:hypothetical protein